VERATIITFGRIRPIARGGDIVTVPLVTKASVEGARITTGISTYPPGTGAPLHSHNCDEQVTLLSGIAEAEIDGNRVRLEPHDSTYVRAGQEHAFRNAGPEPMTILWIYASARVTRTLAQTGRTVEHLSADDRLADR
jgi:mannose-6-phosphate isomerase-like protein (cupin superfamily)